MRHVLVSSGDAELVEELRGLLPPATVLLSATGVDDTLERLSRSARVDAVLTDDPEVLAAIREEMPGNLPVVLVARGSPAAAASRLLDEALPP